jgi:hypothetical protein
MTPNMGFKVKSVLVDGINIGAVTRYIFKNVNAAHTISVSFKQNTTLNSLSISSNVNPNGSKTIGSINITSGSAPTFNLTPIDGFEVTQILIDGQDAESFSGTTFSTIEIIIVASEIISKRFKDTIGFEGDKNYSISGKALIDVNRFGGSEGELRINFETSRYTSADYSDITMVNGELLWADGDSAKKSIEFPSSIEDDVAAEVFSVKLTSINEPVSEGVNDPVIDIGGEPANSGVGSGGGGCNYHSQMPTNDQAGNIILMLVFSLAIFLRRSKGKVQNNHNWSAKN